MEVAQNLQTQTAEWPSPAVPIFPTTAQGSQPLIGAHVVQQLVTPSKPQTADMSKGSQPMATRPKIVINVVCGDADGPAPRYTPALLHGHINPTTHQIQSNTSLLDGFMSEHGVAGSEIWLETSAAVAALKAHTPAASSGLSHLPKRSPVPEIIPVEEDPDYYMNHITKGSWTNVQHSQHDGFGTIHNMGDYSYCIVEPVFGCSTEQQMYQELLLEEEYIPGWQDVRSRLSEAGPYPLPEQPLISKKLLREQEEEERKQLVRKASLSRSRKSFIQAIASKFIRSSSSNTDDSKPKGQVGYSNVRYQRVKRTSPTVVNSSANSGPGAPCEVLSFIKHKLSRVWSRGSQAVFNNMRDVTQQKKQRHTAPGAATVLGAGAAAAVDGRIRLVPCFEVCFCCTGRSLEQVA